MQNIFVLIIYLYKVGFSLAHVWYEGRACVTAGEIRPGAFLAEIVIAFVRINNGKMVG